MGHTIAVHRQAYARFQPDAVGAAYAQANQLAPADRLAKANSFGDNSGSPPGDEGLDGEAFL
jgi:hypothetical protein